jgi:hypothetical protein
MRRALAWPVAVGRFWYRFIIGDDWTVAAAVGLGLVATAFLQAQHLAAWWLVPLVVVVMIRLSLQRRRRE